MSDLDFHDLSKKLTRFRTKLRKNLYRCDTPFAFSLHDRLLCALRVLLKICRDGAKAQRSLRTAIDPAVRRAFEETLSTCIGDLETSGRGFHPWHLLDAVDCDRHHIRYYHPSLAIWVDGRIPDWMTVGDEHLSGLGRVIRQIADKTGIRFTTYFCDANIGPEGAGELHWSVYQTPVGNTRYAW